jgi:hypothetical protein
MGTLKDLDETKIVIDYSKLETYEQLHIFIQNQYPDKLATLEELSSMTLTIEALMFR